MVSIHDVAKHCNVSAATVSKAINGRPDISEATRERVLQAAADLGYLPNSAARSLKTKRTYNLGVLFVDKKKSGLTHEYFSSVLESFKVEAESHGYDITFINQNIGLQSATYLEHCKHRNVDGVVIACVDFTDPQVLELTYSDIPLVTIDHIFDDRMAVLADNVTGLRELVTYLHGLGHRQIAFIHGEMTAVTRNRLASFHKTCEALGIVVPDAYLRTSEYHDIAGCAEATRALLTLPTPPTAIIFPDDFSAIGGRGVITELGLSIPSDISVAGYDGIYLASVMHPPMTTYLQDTKTLGKIAAEKLIDLIEQPKTTIAEHIVIPGALITGASAASPNSIQTNGFE
ncbi:MAG: LacI family transcriptional regulator [Oscillospiraceae bacterium]|jgi:LacI family transcriptional regulator|nr:LacI family transcriptional regulator [Oscillospiraceae bacterium]